MRTYHQQRRPKRDGKERELRYTQRTGRGGSLKGQTQNQRQRPALSSYSF